MVLGGTLAMVDTKMTSPIVISEKGVTCMGDWTTSIHHQSRRVIPWCDVIACKTNKVSPLQVDLTIHYIHHIEGNIWREEHSTISIEGEKVAEDYCCQIRQAISNGRPQRLLVLINAIAGRGNGEAVYNSTVQPWLELAGIHCTVHVSEYFRHTEQIITTCDIDNIDGILVLGGDGTYQEVVHALIPRVQEQHGVMYTDPAATLQPLPISLGIIPTGTGNGLAQGAYGCVDVETAVLHVITGRRRPVNVVSVHSSDQLVTYCGLVGSIGSWCDLQDRSDSLRWLGLFRHKLGRLSTYIVKNKTFEIDLSYLPVEGEAGTYQKLGNKSTVGSEIGYNEWRNISGPSTGVNVFPPCFYEDETRTRLRWNQDGDGMLVVVEKPTYRWTYANWMGDMQRMLSKAVHYDFITHFHASAVRLTIKNQSGTSDTGKVSVDGEIRRLQHTELHFRVHRNVISLFSSSPQALNI